MLPFIKKKQASRQTGVIIENRAEEQPEQDLSGAAIEACAMELIIALHTKDVKAVAEALKNAFEILESGESNEASPHTYEAQNILAGESK